MKRDTILILEQDDASRKMLVDLFKNKYKIQSQNITEIRKIIAIRYAIAREGYSSTKAITIAKDISRELVAEFSENSDKYSGVNITVQPTRKYADANLASHILGTVGKITDCL